MGLIVYIVLGFILLAVAAYVLSFLRPVIAVVACLSGIYLLVFTDYTFGGILALIVWWVAGSAIERSEDDREGKVVSEKNYRRKNNRKTAFSRGGHPNALLMWMIPLFWPILIFRTFFRDKQVGKLDAYDYEQHLKSNGR